MRDLEQAILAKAAALGLDPPTFRMHQAADLFAGWADRVAEADSLRASGKPYLAALDECDRHLGRPATRVPRPAPTILPLSDWLGDIARALGAPEFYEQVVKPSVESTALKSEGSFPRTPQAAVAAPLPQP